MSTPEEVCEATWTDGCYRSHTCGLSLGHEQPYHEDEETQWNDPDVWELIPLNGLIEVAQMPFENSVTDRLVRECLIARSILRDHVRPGTFSRQFFTEDERWYLDQLNSGPA